MKTLFVHARSDVDTTIPEEVIKKLPKNIGIIASIQAAHKIDEIVKQIEGAVAGGQVLGCNAAMANKIKAKVDAYLFVGSGIFHPIQVAIDTKKPVYCYNPFSKEFKQLDEAQIEEFRKKKQGAINRFLHAKNIGIIVTTKIGQKNLQRALQLKQTADKKYFLFVCDTLDFHHLEDFNFIDCWVNTACPRIGDEKKEIVNINDLIAEGILPLPGHVHYEQPIWIGTKGLKLP